MAAAPSDQVMCRPGGGCAHLYLGGPSAEGFGSHAAGCLPSRSEADLRAEHDRVVRCVVAGAVFACGLEAHCGAL